MSIFTDAVPSTTGAALTSGACFALPAAIPLALMQGTAISNPQQICDAADAHNALCEQAKTTHTDIKGIVDRHATEDQWSSTDKNMYVDTHVTPYLTALDKTGEMHGGASSSLILVSRIYEGLGYLSLTVGTAMAWAAAAVLGVSWVPGVNAVAEAAGTGLAETSSGFFRSALLRLGTLLLRVGKFLSSIKNLLPALKFTVGVPLVLEAPATMVASSAVGGSANSDSATEWATAEQSKLKA